MKHGTIQVNGETVAQMDYASVADRFGFVKAEVGARIRDHGGLRDKDVQSGRVDWFCTDGTQITELIASCLNRRETP